MRVLLPFTLLLTATLAACSDSTGPSNEQPRGFSTSEANALSRALLTAEMIGAAGELGHAIAGTHLGNRVAYPQSMGEGRTVVETAPGGMAAEEVEALAREIIKHARKR